MCLYNKEKHFYYIEAFLILKYLLFRTRLNQVFKV